MPTLYIADAERDADMKNLSRKEAAKVLEDMKSKGEIPKAAVTQWKRNTALDMAIEALKYSEVPNSSDCISRQAAIDALAELARERFTIQDCFQIYLDALTDADKNIQQLPPIQPEIIRCKDCKHWIPYDWMFSEMWQSKNIADYPEDEIDCEWCEMSMKANDFCSRAERREETT